MKAVLFSIFICATGMVSAHEHHHGEELKATPFTADSIWQLKSTWKNQKGDSRSLGSLKGKPRLVAMLFTRCETACPLLVEDMKEITDVLDRKSSEKIPVALFSLDSFRETPESLSAFATKRKLPSHWELYTSNAGAVAELAAALGVRYKRLASGDFIHSNIIFYLDEQGEIKAKKEGLKTANDDFFATIKASSKTTR